MSARRVVARYRTSAILEKSWITGIRRGWLKLMSPAISDWGDVHRAIQRLEDFVENLRDQVLFARRGPYSGSPSMTEGKKVQALLEQLLGEIQQKKSSAKHWEQAAKGDLTVHGFSVADGEKMFALYRDNFDEATATSIRRRGGGGLSRGASLTEILDKILKILREDAKRIQQNDKNNPGGPYEDQSVYKEFDLNGMKVVIDDRRVSAAQIKSYLQYFEETYQRMSQKGFKKAWYGTLFVRCAECGGTNPNGAEFGVGGNYHIYKDTVQIFSRPSSFIVSLVAHELGHRYWFKQMGSEQRARFESLVRIEKKNKPTKPSPLQVGFYNTAPGAFNALHLLFKEFEGEKQNNRWWRDVLKTYEERFHLAGRAIEVKVDEGTKRLNQDIGQSLSFDEVIHDPDVQANRKEVHSAVWDLSGYLSAFEKDMDKEVTNEPEPAKAPDSLDAYWWGVFEKVRKDWLETARFMADHTEGAVAVYFDTAVATHNRLEQEKYDKRLKEWEEEKERDKRSILPVTQYGGSNIDEAFAEVFAHYITGEDMTRDQLESFKEVVKTAARVVRRYKASLTEVTQDQVDRWRKDLRVMTKIYKSIPTDDSEKALDMMAEARGLFNNFRNRFEKWVYKFVLPSVEKGRESYHHREIQKLAWDAIISISSGLFPDSWDYKQDKHVPAPWLLSQSRDKNITKYNRAFNLAFKAIEEYLREGPAKRYEDERYDIEGMKVLVPGFARGKEYLEGALQSSLKDLKDYAKLIRRAGFSKALKGLEVVLSSESTKGLVAGQYEVAKDQMMVSPLGLGSPGTFTHEVGHRHWFKNMPSQARAYWEEVMGEGGALTKVTSQDVDVMVKLVSGMISPDGFAPDPKEIRSAIERLSLDDLAKARLRDLSDFPVYPPLEPGAKFIPAEYRGRLNNRVGEPVLIEEISEYANSGGPKESFAEAFRLYVLKGPQSLGPLTRSVFERVALR